MTTEPTDPASETTSRLPLVGGSLAVGGFLAGAVLLGLSLVAGLFLLLPLLFLGVLVRTAYGHYFGRSGLPERSP